MLIFGEFSHHAAESRVVDLGLFALLGFSDHAVDKLLPDALVDVLEDARIENLLQLLNPDVTFVVLVEELEGELQSFLRKELALRN